MARIRYVQKLKNLQRDVEDMGAVTVRSVEQVLHALKTSDAALAERVIANDDVINKCDRKIESQCMTLLALEQPMAKDLRVIATSLKMITDLERIGDFAADIGYEVVAMQKPIRVPISVAEFEELTDEVKLMVADSIETYARGDVQKARTFEARDDRVDQLYKQIINDIVRTVARRGCSVEIIAQTASFLYVIRYLERIADHAVNIGTRVCYMEEGERRHLK